MNEDGLILARKTAETAVADMADGPLKVAAFQTILARLLDSQTTNSTVPGLVTSRRKQTTNQKQSTGTTDRILALFNEGFFAQQRSLPDIQKALAERGWHYPQENLGTPMTRLVRKKVLRRAQIAESGRKIWKYSTY